MKILLDDRLHAHHHCPLDDLVLTAGLASGPLLPPFLRDPYPFDRRRHVPIAPQPLMQVPEVLVQVFGVRLRCDLVHAWSTARVGLALGFPETIPVDQMTHVIAHHHRRALCLFCNPLEGHGDGWGARRLSQRSLQMSLDPASPSLQGVPGTTVPHLPGFERLPLVHAHAPDHSACRPMPGELRQRLDLSKSE